MSFGRFGFLSPKAVSGAYEMTLDDNCILHTAGASNTAVYLPKASRCKGKAVVIQKVDSGAGYTVVTAASGDTINNGSSTSVNITAQWGKVLLVSDGVSRWIQLV